MVKNPFQFRKFIKQLFTPPIGQYHPAITGVRAIAFLWIVIFHCLVLGNLLLPSFEEYVCALLSSSFRLTFYFVGMTNISMKI